MRAALLIGMASFVVCGARPALAQSGCENPAWLPSQGLASANGGVLASTMWDPDGPSGPKPALLVMAGGFSAIGNTLANRIATYDPETKEIGTLGSGFLPGNPLALLSLPDGGLLVGGSSLKTAGTKATHLKRWDGQAWNDDEPIGASVRHLALDPVSGTLAAATWSGSGNGVHARIGGSWGQVGSVFDDDVMAVAVRPGGEIIAGGIFQSAGGTALPGIARWSGAGWEAMGNLAGQVRVLREHPNGTLIAAGYLSNFGPGNAVAVWDGSTWKALDSGGATYGSVHSLDVLPGNGLVVGGTFTAIAGTPATNVALWNGNAWEAIGEGWPTPLVTMTRLPSGDLFAGVSGSPGGTAATIQWDGAGWSLFPGTSAPVGPISAMRYYKGDLILGGGFETTHAGNTKVNHIMRWDGEQYHALGAGLASGEFVSRGGLGEFGDELVVTGNFTKAGEVTANYIARWDGSVWKPLGSGFDYIGRGMTEWNDQLVVGGLFTKAGGVGANRIAKWNGVAWSPIGAGFNDEVRDVVVHAGELVAVGNFTATGTTSAMRVARWDGTAWMPMGDGFNDAAIVVVSDPFGRLLVGGQFSVGNPGQPKWGFISQWDGKAWGYVGGGVGGGSGGWVSDILVEANGDVLITGSFLLAPQNKYVQGIAKWNGTEWVPIGLGLGVAFGHALVAEPTGTVACGGTFTVVSKLVQPFVARFGCEQSPCFGDCDADQTLTIDDFICFQTRFAFGEPGGDCDGNGSFNVLDFICFQTAFAVGC